MIEIEPLPATGILRAVEGTRWPILAEYDGWKIRMLTWNITPAPAAPAQTK